MPQEVQGVIARSVGAPVEVTTIVVPDPGPGEVVVAVQACGVCHTDLHYRDGGINDEFPFLLGHEAAGIVESVGPDVTDVEPGDFVILNWRAVCGECRSCRRGRPQYCFSTHNATQKMTLTDGTELSPALGIGASMLTGEVGRGGALKPSWSGDCLPRRDFPMLIDLYLQGRLDLDRFVSETISIDDVEEAFHKLERGEVLRSVVVM